jgi:hypothetical protein
MGLDIGLGIKTARKDRTFYVIFIKKVIKKRLVAEATRRFLFI